MNTGIYLIRNKINNKFYVGSASRSFGQRFSMHKYQLKRNQHHSPYLQKSWNKYGEDNFEFIILVECPKNECIQTEQFFIDELSPAYNNCKIAGSRLGSKNLNPSSKEVVKKRKEKARQLGLSLKGKKHTKESIQKFKDGAIKKRIFAENMFTGEKLEFISQMDASKELQIDKRHISRICNGKRKSAKNWTFKWLT